MAPSSVAIKWCLCPRPRITFSTRQKHYVDDLTWTKWQQKGGSVVVQVDSESEPNSIGDYDTNFCNNFNLFRNGNAHKLNFDIDISYTECSNSHHPDTSNGYDAAYKQCDTY